MFRSLLSDFEAEFSTNIWRNSAMYVFSRNETKEANI
jgi:hypothetical protein